MPLVLDNENFDQKNQTDQVGRGDFEHSDGHCDNQAVRQLLSMPLNVTGAGIEKKIVFYENIEISPRWV